MTRRSPAIRTVLLFAVLAVANTASAQDLDEPQSDEYRVTLFPFHKLTDEVSGFGYLGYVKNPDKDYTTEYLGYGLSYFSSHNVQWWAGLVTTFTQNEATSDKFELRPFVGLKNFIPNSIHWNIYNYFRWEYRAIEDKGTDDWAKSSRLRDRFGIEAPLTSGDRAWKPKTWYALSDVEAMYRTDHSNFDPIRLRFGIAYIPSARVRVELIYHLQWTRPDPNGKLVYTDNIWRLNIKVALNHGVLQRVFDGGDSID